LCILSVVLVRLNASTAQQLRCAETLEGHRSRQPRTASGWSSSRTCRKQTFITRLDCRSDAPRTSCAREGYLLDGDPTSAACRTKASLGRRTTKKARRVERLCCWRPPFLSISVLKRLGSHRSSLLQCGRGCATSRVSNGGTPTANGSTVGWTPRSVQDGPRRSGA
jgi:hypothetical protein